MKQSMLPALLLLAAIGSGLIGGLFFAFSNFVMRALNRRPPAEAIATMQAINVTVLNPIFFAAFFGTAVASIGLIAFAVTTPNSSTALAIAGGSLYLAGSILVTIVGNVPLNVQLAAVDLSAADPAGLADRWQAFRNPWMLWNHARTISSLLAAAAFAAALRGV